MKKCDVLHVRSSGNLRPVDKIARIPIETLLWPLCHGKPHASGRESNGENQIAQIMVTAHFPVRKEVL